MTLDSILGTILVRDHYRRVRMEYLSRIILGVGILLLVSLLANTWLFNKPPAFHYVFVGADGAPVQMTPLDRPHMSDDDVLTWTVDAVTRIHTYDFVNYRRQFQEARTMMTGGGWDAFEEALTDSGNFNSVVSNGYVTTAVPTGPAEIVGREIVDAGGGDLRYMWVIEFPMVVTYRSAQQTTSMDLRLKVTTVRMPRHNYEHGLAVRQILAWG